MGPMPLQVMNALHATAKRLRRLQQLLLDELIVPLCADAGRVPQTNELLAVQAQLHQLTAKQVAKENRRRVQHGLDTMDKAWMEKRRSMYRWVKGKEDPPLVMLERDDGTLTANVAEMDELVRLAWGPIIRKYEDMEEPDDELFMQA